VLHSHHLLLDSAGTARGEVKYRMYQYTYNI
jgi:hypothetical protein